MIKEIAGSSVFHQQGKSASKIGCFAASDFKLLNRNFAKC